MINKKKLLSNVTGLFMSCCVATILSSCSSNMQNSAGHGHSNNAENNASLTMSYEEHMEEFKNVVGDRVYFCFDRYDLSDNAMAVLSTQLDWLKMHKDFIIIVEGHCDERGTREYNLALGERRANSVKEFLVKHGINESRIEVRSYGKDRPAELGRDERAWQYNRRAVVVIK